MDLKTFISQSIVEISEAIQEAQENAPNAIINPKIFPTAENKGRVADHPTIDYATFVHFDVCVTAQDKDSTNGAAGIKVVGFNIGAGLTTETTNQSSSRIKFDIPIIFPRK